MVSDTEPMEARPDRILVIGYGSTLRGDDGVGPAVAGMIQAMNLEGVGTIACHQLTPELADPISQARMVVFVDAAMDLPDDRVRVSTVEAEGQHQVMVHTSSPGGLLQLAKSVFGFCPEGWLVAVPVAEMGIGEKLSKTAELGVEQAVVEILKIIGR